MARQDGSIKAEPGSGRVAPFPVEVKPAARVEPLPAIQPVPAAQPVPAPQPVDEPDAKPDEQAPASDAKPEAAPKKKRSFKPVIFGVAFLAAATAGGYYGHEYWTVGRFMVKTDDAYLQADITVLSPRIQGYVSEILFRENEPVKAGAPIIRLDDGDYTIALEVAKNRARTLTDTLARIDAQETAAKAGVVQARASRDAVDITIHNAQVRFDRTQGLARTAVASKASLDDARDALAAAKAQATGADAAIAAAQAQVGVIAAQRAETANQKRDLELGVAQAQRNLDLTVLRAPVDGTFTNLSVKLGDLVSPGARMAAVVPHDSLYIEAFYKETQLGDIHPGAVAHLSIDALDGPAYTGHVTSISPATGSTFTLLPPDNATGNFTKIVQRVGVRVALDDPSVKDRLRAGLSTVVEIDSRTGTGAAAPEATADAAAGR